VENSPSLVISAPFNFIARRHRRHKQVHQSAISIGKRATAAATAAAAAAEFNQAGRDIILFAPSGSRGARRERSFLIKPRRKLGRARVCVCM
jgi:hypothetical protein